MDEDAIRRAVEALDNSEKEKQLDVLYWYYHPDIPSLNKNIEIGEKVHQHQNWVWQKLKVIKGKFEVVGIYNIDDPRLRSTIWKIINEVRDPEYQPQERAFTPFPLLDPEPETPSNETPLDTPPPDAPPDETPLDAPPPDAPPDETPLDTPLPDAPPDETPLDAPPPDAPPPPPPDESTGDELLPSPPPAGAGVNWRTFLTLRGAIFLALGIISLIVIWAAFTFNPFTLEPIDPPEVENPVEVAEEVAGQEEPLPTPDRSDFNTAVAQSVAATDTAEAPTIEAELTRDFQNAVETAAVETRNSGATQTAQAIPTNTPSSTPTIAPSLTPSITPTPSDTPTITPIPPLLFEDFEDGNFAGWEVLSGDWTIDENDDSQHGLMCLRKGVIVYNDTEWTNYTVSADVTFVTETGTVMVLGRRHSPWDYYRADLLAEGSARLVNNYWVNTQRNDAVVVQSVFFPVTIGQTYNIEMRMFGIQISILVDGQEVVSLTHNGHANGSVGLRCGDSTIAVFDNILVEKLGN